MQESNNTLRKEKTPLRRSGSSTTRLFDVLKSLGKLSSNRSITKMSKSEMVNRDVSLEEIRSKMVRGGDFENNMLTIREMRRRSSLLALDSSEIVSKNRWTINPNSKIAIYWHVVVTCSILYTVVLSPYDLAFGDRVLFVEENKHWIWTVLAVSIDLIFLFDIVVQFRLHRPTSGGYITNPAEIAKSYLKFWFWLDVIVGIPFELMSIFMSTNLTLNSLKILKTVRLLRLGKLIKFQSAFAIEIANAYRVISLLFVTIITAHIFGCIFIYIATQRINERGTDRGSGEVTWMDNMNIVHHDNSFVYWTAMTVSLNVLLGGNFDPVSKIEMVVYCLFRILGSVLSATIFGQMGVYISNIQRSSTRFQEQMDNVNEIIRNLKLPRDLKIRIFNYYEYKWVRTKGLDISWFLDDLSPNFRADVSLCLHREMVQGVPVFHDIAPDFLVSIVQLLQSQIYLPGDYIIREGERGREMYFITRGRCQVIASTGSQSSKSEIILKMLKQGEFFGELALLYEVRRTVSIRAAAFCDLSLLSKGDFDDCLQQYPESAEKIRDLTEQRLNAVYQDLQGSTSQSRQKLNKIRNRKSVSSNTSSIASGTKSVEEFDNESSQTEKECSKLNEEGRLMESNGMQSIPFTTANENCKSLEVDLTNTGSQAYIQNNTNKLHKETDDRLLHIEQIVSQLALTIAHSLPVTQNPYAAENLKKLLELCSCANSAVQSEEFREPNPIDESTTSSYSKNLIKKDSDAVHDVAQGLGNLEIKDLLSRSLNADVKQDYENSSQAYALRRSKSMHEEILAESDRKERSRSFSVDGKFNPNDSQELQIGSRTKSKISSPLRGLFKPGSSTIYPLGL